MIMRNRWLGATAAALTLLWAAGYSPGDDPTLWYTIDGGGAMETTGGSFTLSGSIGQPEAGETPMTGGTFSLAGGFWIGAVSNLFGDCDNSWHVGPADFEPYAACLQGPDVPTGPGCTCPNVDADDDGDGDLADFAVFQRTMGAP
jgi:hypothetical protein